MDTDVSGPPKTIDSKPRSSLVAVFDFLKVLGASLTGLTAILTAAGFLAERSRLAMLGLPSATFDLELYVETGAFFLALLPVVMAVASFLILLSVLRGPLELILTTFSPVEFLALLALGILVAVIAARRLRREPNVERNGGTTRGARLVRSVRDRLARRAGNVRRILRRNRLPLLLLTAVIVQIWAVSSELAALDVRDVLFEPLASGSSVDFDGRPNRRTAFRTFGGIVLSTLFSTLVLYYVVRDHLAEPRVRWRRYALRAWVAATALLLVSQITLLPYSYGVLLSRNNYPEVCAVTADEPTVIDRLPNHRLSLIRQDGDGLYLYSRSDRAMWFVPASRIRSIVYYDRADVLQTQEPQACPSEDLP